MSGPDRPKRPSARPSRRTSLLPPAPEVVVQEADAVTTESVPAVQGSEAAEPSEKRVSTPSASSTSKSGEPASKASRARVSARRASQAPAAEAAVMSDERTAASDDVSVAGVTTPVSTKKKARATRPPQARARPSESVPGRPSDEANVEEDDIWQDSAPLPELAQSTRAVVADTSELALEQRSNFKPASRLARGASAQLPASDAALIGSAQSLLSTDYYFRQYGAHGIRSRSAEVDEFGLDPHFEERARPALELLCKRYFRVNVDGAQNLPSAGRALIVGNRAGTLPWDGLVLRTALRLARPELSPLRWLSEDSVFHYPFLGVFMNRLGAVRACPENAERLLAQDKLVAVFPEGAQGSRKLFKDRYRLQRFGRGGYVKLALKLSAPIVPTAIIGAEETNPVLARSRLLGRMVGTEYFPFTPTFPWLGPVGLLPAPVKWRIVVGEPIDLSSYGPEAAEDALLVHRLNEQIRGILQDLLKQGAASRRSVLFG